MKMVDSCVQCELIATCYYNNFESCPRIEMAAQGLGIPFKHKTKATSWTDHIPFGVYMTLKHMVSKGKELRADVIPDIPKIEYSRVEFAKKLAIETTMSQEEASILVSEISMYGSIKDAIECYDKHSFRTLELYLAGCKARLRLGGY